MKLDQGKSCINVRGRVYPITETQTKLLLFVQRKRRVASKLFTDAELRKLTKLCEMGAVYSRLGEFEINPDVIFLQ